METQQFEILSVGINGEGVAKHNGKPLFVPFALDGDVAKVETQNSKKNFENGKLVEIEKASKNRVAPRCPYYGKCGGCCLQHSNYNHQKEIKTQIVANNLKKFAKYNGKIEPCFGAAEYEYRNKVVFPVSKDGVCMFLPQSHNTIKIDQCVLAGEWNKTLIEVFDKWFATSQNCAFDWKTGSGNIKQLVARFVNDQILVCLVCKNKNVKNIQELAQKLAQKFNKMGLWLCENPKPDSEILSGRFVHVAGIKNIEYQIFGLKTTLSVDSFLQINNEVSSKIYSQVTKNVAAKKVVNAYSGAGLLSAMLAKTASEVVGIEIVESAHKNAQFLKESNNISNLTNICGDCAQELLKVGQFDCIVLDPPRKGCDGAVLEQIQKVLPTEIIYISCDSATLARDIALLTNYQIKSVEVFDMFPQTRHVETLAILQKK